MGPTIFGPTPETLEAQRKAAVAYGDATWGKGPSPNFTQVNDAYKAQPASRTQVGTIGGGPGTPAVVSPVFGTVPQTPASPVRAPVPVVPAAAAMTPEQQAADDAARGAINPPKREPYSFFKDISGQWASTPDEGKNLAATGLVLPPTQLPATAASTAAPAPVAAPAGNPNYGNEHRRPLAAGATGTPAVAAPSGVPATPQQAYDTPGSIFSASKGGKTYTPEQLAAMAGPDNSALVKTPMEIYANEMALNAAMPDRVRGGVIGGGGDFGPRPQTRVPPEQANAQAAFFGAAQGQKGKNIATAGAQMQLDQQKAITDLHQKILATKDPKTRAALIQDLLALTGKRGGQNPIAVKGGQAIGPDGMTVFSQPEAVFDPNTGAFTYQGGGGAAAAPQQAQIAAIKAQVQAGTMPRDEAVKQLKALGLE